MATARLDVPQIPDEPLPDAESAEGGASDVHPGSLLDDVEALIEDGKTYAEAELEYQKSRAAYAFKRAGRAAIFGAFAAVMVVLALLSVVIGALISLIPVLGPWGATGAVVCVLMLSAAILWALARAQLSDLLQTFGGERE